MVRKSTPSGAKLKSSDLAMGFRLHINDNNKYTKYVNNYT